MPPNRQARIGIPNGWLSEEIPYFSFLQKEKCGMTRMVFIFLVCCSPTAEDSHEPKASCSPPQWGGAANCVVLKNRRRRIVNGKVFGTQPAGNATMRMPLRASARRGCVPRDSTSRNLFLNIFFLRYLLCGQKVTPKTAAVKRFRGRPCSCAESDARGIFEDQKVSDS